MATVRTFVDADVLIWAARGHEPLSNAALDVLTDENREFVASDFLRLEVLPKAAYHQQAAEEAFYRCFFDAVTIWYDSSAALLLVQSNLQCVMVFRLLMPFTSLPRIWQMPINLSPPNGQHRLCSAFKNCNLCLFVPRHETHPYHRRKNHCKSTLVVA